MKHYYFLGLRQTKYGTCSLDWARVRARVSLKIQQLFQEKISAWISLVSVGFWIRRTSLACHMKDVQVMSYRTPFASHAARAHFPLMARVHSNTIVVQVGTVPMYLYLPDLSNEHLYQTTRYW